MTRTRLRHGLTLCALVGGMAVPVLYYGIQAVAAPFFPGFSVVSTTASELGSDLADYAWVFNAGIITLGCLTIFASAGFLSALLRLGVNPLLAVPTAVALLVNGVQSLWAGIYPMPDPRHGGHPAFIVGMLLMPPLLTASLWRLSDSWLLRAYFLATVALLIAFVPVMSGMAGVDTHSYRGLLQRAFTLTVFPPIAVAAYVLLRRLRATPLWPVTTPA